jgi:hypothetical protein
MSGFIRHDGEEFLLADFSVLVKIEFVDHGLTRERVANDDGT